MNRSQGASSSVVASVICIVILGAAFGLYFVSSESSMQQMNSKISSLQVASSEASEALVAQQSRIACLETQVQSLQSEISAESSSSSITSSANSAVSCISSNSGPLRLVNLTGSLTVPSGTAVGALLVTVWNGANVPITEVSVNVTSSGLSTQSGPPEFSYQGKPVSITNPMPQGVTITGNATLASGSSGLYATYGYDLDVTISFLDGFTQTQGLYVMAQV